MYIYMYDARNNYFYNDACWLEYMYLAFAL